MQTPKQILAEIKMKNAIKKAEQAREEETNNFKQRGFSSKEEYADFLDKRDRIQASKSGAISAKKAAIAGVVAAAGIGAGLYAMNNMGRNNNEPSIPDYYNPPVDPSQPVNPNIDPDDFEEIVNNPSYQEQANKILEDAKEAISGIENQVSSDIQQAYDQIQAIEQANGITDQNVFGGHMQQINEYVRLDGESAMTYLVRIKNDALESKSEYNEQWVEYVNSHYPQFQEFFDSINLELNYDNFDMLRNLALNYTPETEDLLLAYHYFTLDNTDAINDVLDIEPMQQIWQTEGIIDTFDSYIDRAVALMNSNDKEAFDALTEQIFESDDTITAMANEIWDQYMQELYELQISYITNNYDFNSFVGGIDIQTDNNILDAKANVIGNQVNETHNVTSQALSSNQDVLSGLNIDSSIDALQESTMNTELAPYIAAGVVVAGAAIIAGMKLRKNKTEKKQESNLAKNEERTL